MKIIRTIKKQKSASTVVTPANLKVIDDLISGKLDTQLANTIAQPKFGGIKNLVPVEGKEDKSGTFSLNALRAFFAAYRDHILKPTEPDMTPTTCFRKGVGAGGVNLDQKKDIVDVNKIQPNLIKVINALLNKFGITDPAMLVPESAVQIIKGSVTVASTKEEKVEEIVKILTALDYMISNVIYKPSENSYDLKYVVDPASDTALGVYVIFADSKFKIHLKGGEVSMYGAVDLDDTLDEAIKVLEDIRSLDRDIVEMF